SAEDRDLLVAYADRVGVDLESQALSDDVQMLEALGPGIVRAPDLYACDPTLVVASGPQAGKLLWDVLDVPKEPILGIVAQAREGAASVGVRAQDGRMLRVTLSPGPGT